MPKKRLTEEGVRKLKPPAAGKQVDYFDAGMPGLVLRVNYGGAKVWRALYYLKRLDQDGKSITIPTTHKLGVYPVLDLKQAREKARAFLADPQKALAKAAEADTGSFGKVAENFLKRHVEASGLRTQDEIVRCLNKYIYPHWRDRPFHEIKRRDVADLLDLVEDQNGARQADYVLAIIRKMMNWYATRNDDYVSPIVRGMQRRNGSAHKRKRILDDAELHALWQATADMGTFGALVKTLLLTGQRLGKVSQMRWTDLVEGEWSIPKAAREKTTAGTLKLPPMALHIINAQPRLAGNPYVFAGSARGRRRVKIAPAGPPAFNSFSEGKHELEAKLPKSMPQWQLHDLRRTARSLMSRAGVRPDISERVLGHAIPGVEGVYDQHHYSEDKADALDRLAKLIGEIVNPPPQTNVVRLGGSKRPRVRASLGL
jgi:integrase